MPIPTIDIKKTNELSTDLYTITAEINAYQRIAGEAIFEIGRRLKHVKYNPHEYGLPAGTDKEGNTIVARGAWGEWLAEVEINDRVARQFITVAKELDDGKRRTSSDKGLQALYEIATMPAEEREKPHVLATGETKTVDEMTVRELREVKKALKESEEKRKKLEEEVSKPPKVECIEVESIPDDYETLRIENEKLRSVYGTTRIVDEDKREGFYREFADELEYLRIKYGSILADAVKTVEFAKKDRDYASKVNDFDDFWKSFAKTMFKDQIIINMEG